MASTSNYPYHFPYFPPTPPHNFPSPPISPPSHTPPKPAPPSPTTPTSHNPPTPPKAPPPSKTSPPSPHVFPTPPPPHHIVPTPPPPPHIHPIPPPPPHVVPTPPPPPPAHHSTVIVVVFVSLGGLFLLAFMAVALCCFIKKRKKSVQETDVKIDEHLKIQEAIIPGPHGTQTVILSVEDDVHIQEEINKNIETLCKGSHITSAEGHHHPKVLDLEASTSGSEHHQHLEHKTA